MAIRATVDFSPLALEPGDYRELSAIDSNYTKLTASAYHAAPAVTDTFANYYSLNQLPKDIMPLSDLVGVVPRKVITDTVELYTAPVGFHRIWGEVPATGLTTSDTAWFKVSRDESDNARLLDPIQLNFVTSAVEGLPLLSSTALRFIHSISDSVDLSEYVVPARIKFAAVALLEDLKLDVHATFPEYLQLDSNVSKELIRGLQDDTTLDDRTKLRLAFTVEEYLRIQDTVADPIRRPTREPSSGINITDTFDKGSTATYTDETLLSSVVVKDYTDDEALTNLGLQDEPAKRLYRAVRETIDLTLTIDHIRYAESNESTLFHDAYHILAHKIIPDYADLVEELGKDFSKGVIEETAALIEQINKRIQHKRESVADVLDYTDVRYQGHKDTPLALNSSREFRTAKPFTDFTALGSSLAKLHSTGAPQSLELSDPNVLTPFKPYAEHLDLGDTLQHIIRTRSPIFNVSVLNSSTLG